jgi:cytochrome oxidase Cu insertion factor (SCO1/SenC/PrrC family)
LTALPRIRRLAWGAVLALLLVLAALHPRLALPGRAAAGNPYATTPLGGLPAPDFTLSDQYGRQLRLSDFRGRVVAMAFIDSRCTETCPLTAQSMLDYQRALGRRAADVQLLAVNTNPLATSTADVRQWTDAHGMTGHWLFLTGDAATLQPIWSAYHIGVEVDRDTGKITHTDAVYIIDRQGREQQLLVPDETAGGIRGDARSLLAATLPLLGGRSAL